MNLIANRVTEKDLRQHLTGMGYVGRSAKITGLELVAIERPGWVQVFEFQMRALKQGGDWEEFLGFAGMTSDRRNLKSSFSAAASSSNRHSPAGQQD